MQKNLYTRLIAQRIELKSNISANDDWIISLADILSGSGIDADTVLSVVPEGARPEVSWSQVQPVVYFNTNNNKWGVHNNGTGGVAVITFVVTYGFNFI